MLATETSPLLESDLFQNDLLSMPVPPTRFPVLLELIGARNLPLTSMETYCVVQFGPKTIHRTKPFSPKLSKAARISQALQMHRIFGGTRHQILQRSLGNPIWTIHENALLVFHISSGDIENNKALKITLWGRPRNLNLKDRAANVMAPRRRTNQLESVGKIKISASSILKSCTEERLETQLVDELGNAISDSSGEPSLLGYRCRIASKADLAFVDHWGQIPRPKHWKDTGVIQEPQNPRASLVTEIQEQKVLAKGPSIKSGYLPAGHVRIKPYPDPNAKYDDACFTTPSMLKTQTVLPSQNWMQAGSQGSSLGRLYLEVLSAHGLPNVDVGSTVGNVTDAFCAAVYGDAMVQTDVIFDELNPHWPSWSQRAFVFYMQHPSQVLYLSVLGYKRSPLQHRAIGRVEVNPVNLQNKTVYNLEYDLCGRSHAAERCSRGKLRIRVRIEMDDERKCLLAALKPPPPVYINTTKKKSMSVARYTTCGEYDNEAKFSMAVLQGYIDEIVEGYIRRIFYAVSDGTRSLIFWRDQIQIFDVGFPIYSLMAFVVGVLIIEHPQLFPAFLCFACAALFLNEMQQRLASPSPWRRCFSFTHFLRILVIGQSNPLCRSTGADEGVDEMRAQDEALRNRIEHDKAFIEKKEAIEKEIEEIENFKVQNSSNAIPVDLLVILGKVQSIVGDVCRLCRFMDAIVTWEESDVAFWITFALLVLGTVFLFIPWAFLLQWTGRILIVLFLGPQNKVLDLVWYQNLHTDEQQIYQIFAERMFEARCHQEEAGKLKAFRHVLFGKYATWVPPLVWSPHMDFPLPSSTATGGRSKGPGYKTAERLPLMAGQQLHGPMIPRPEEEWKRNAQETAGAKERVDAVLATMAMTETYEESSSLRRNLREPSIIFEEGLEITDLIDEEALFVANVLKAPVDESIHELGVEILRTSGDEEELHFAAELAIDEEESSSSDDSMIIPTTSGPIRIPTGDRRDQQSMIELGYELEEESKDDDDEKADKHPSRSTLSNASARKKKGVISRHEKWEESSDLTGITTRKTVGASSAQSDVIYATIGRTPTIIDTGDDDDEEYGFEVVEC